MNIKNKHNKGFTMVEMLTVATIIVILIAAAVPGWRNFVQNNQAATIASKLHATLMLARTSAIQSGERTYLCPVTAPSGTTCQNISNWDAWILFMDKNTNGTIDTGETLKIYYDQPAGIIKATTDGTTLYNGSVYFDASGFASVNLIFNILPPGCVGNNGRALALRKNGNIQVDAINCP